MLLKLQSISWQKPVRGLKMDELIHIHLVSLLGFSDMAMQ